MANAMNFSVEFYETSDATEAKWGRLESNGSATGLLGEMVNLNLKIGKSLHVGNELPSTKQTFFISPVSIFVCSTYII